MTQNIREREREKILTLLLQTHSFQMFLTEIEKKIQKLNHAYRSSSFWFNLVIKSLLFLHYFALSLSFGFSDRQTIQESDPKTCGFNWLYLLTLISTMRWILLTWKYMLWTKVKLSCWQKIIIIILITFSQSFLINSLTRK